MSAGGRCTSARGSLCSVVPTLLLKSRSCRKGSACILSCFAWCFDFVLFIIIISAKCDCLNRGKRSKYRELWCAFFTKRECFEYCAPSKPCEPLF